MKKLKVAALLIIIVICGMTALAQDSTINRIYKDTSGNSMDQEKAGAKTDMDMSNTISVQQLKQMMKDTSLVVLDVRNPEEVTGSMGKIEGSINIPVKDLDSRISELNSYSGKTIAIISNSDTRSADAQKILTEHGFMSKRVRGGIEEYQKSGNN
jgi:rhodanese-related sulfurtransferase